MDINSLISGITTIGRGVVAPRSTAIESPALESASDTVVLSGRDPAKGSATARDLTDGLYTRAAASGTALKHAGQTNGQDEGNSQVAHAVGKDTVSGGQEKDSKPQDSSGIRNIKGEPLSSSEMEVLSQLKKIDTAVHTHEMAHLAAAGGYAKGGASYTYRRGPDGQSYAVGGEVMIDTSPAATPAATMAKMQIVRQAALAPANPSGQDQRVAAQATVQIAEAAQELVQLGSQVQAVENQPSKNNISDSAGDQNTTPGEVYSRIFASAVTNSSYPSKNSADNLLRGYGSVKIPQTSASSDEGLNLVI